MKTSINILLQQLEKYIEIRELAAKKSVKPDETRFYIFGTALADFFVIVITFSENEVIEAISAPFDVEGLLRLIADEDEFELDFKYIYPICDKDTTWTDIEYPLIHLMSKGEELYMEDGEAL